MNAPDGRISVRLLPEELAFLEAGRMWALAIAEIDYADGYGQTIDAMEAMRRALDQTGEQPK